MIGRWIRMTLVLLVGWAIAGALYWGLLNVPESNVAMLGLSLLLAVSVLAVAGMTATLAVLMAAREERGTGLVRRLLAGILVFAVAAVVYALVRMAAGALDARYAAATGQIDAWFIATFDWTNTAWLHRLVDWLLWGLGHVAAASLASGILVAGTLARWKDAVHPRALLTMLRPRRLVVMAVVLLALVWLPWQAAYWRPPVLPASMWEPVFAGTKLLIIAALAASAAALILWLATEAAGRHTTTPADTRRPAPADPPAV